MQTPPPPTHASSADARTPLTFALAGELVSTASHAKRILQEAIKAGRAWQIPQAESVLRQLRAQVPTC